MNKPPARTASKVEEIISALWTIAGMLTWSAGYRWFAGVMFFLALTALFLSAVYAVTRKN